MCLPLDVGVVGRHEVPPVLRELVLGGEAEAVEGPDVRGPRGEHARGPGGRGVVAAQAVQQDGELGGLRLRRTWRCENTMFEKLASLGSTTINGFAQPFLFLKNCCPPPYVMACSV